MKKTKKGIIFVLLILAVIIIISPPIQGRGCFRSCVNYLDQYCTGGIFLYAACHGVHRLACGALCSML